jgi:hypothetical protein
MTQDSVQRREHGDEPLAAFKGDKFRHELNDCQLMGRESAPRCWLQQHSETVYAPSKYFTTTWCERDKRNKTAYVLNTKTRWPEGPGSRAGCIFSRPKTLLYLPEGRKGRHRTRTSCLASKHESDNHIFKHDAILFFEMRLHCACTCSLVFVSTMG